jgi:hypothetical protein
MHCSLSLIPVSIKFLLRHVKPVQMWSSIDLAWVKCREKDLKRYIENAVEVDPDRPVLVDKYLDRADELDVDALCDKDGNVVICGIMQHIEQAGVHSGAARMVLILPCFWQCCQLWNVAIIVVNITLGAGEETSASPELPSFLVQAILHAASHRRQSPQSAWT